MAFGLQTFNEYGDATFDSTRPMLHLGNTLINLPYRPGNYGQFDTVALPDEVPHWVKLEQLRVVVTPITFGSMSYYNFFGGAFTVTPVSLSGRMVTLRRERDITDWDYGLPQCTIRFCWISSL